jgi:predicted PurR-regulated permease PerM
MIDLQSNLPRTILGVLFIGGLIAASFWILHPFLPAAIWATTIVVATWPLMLRVQASLWGRRSLAVLVMTLLLLFAFFVPLLFAINSIVENAETISGWAKSLASVSIPSPPDWVGSIPFVGQKIAVAWQQFAAYGPEEFAARIAPYQEQATHWMLTQLGGVGAMFIEFVLTVMIAAVLYSSGENAIAAVRRFARRLAGPQGEAAVTLAGQAIRGIALGVIVTALAQSVLGGIGLAVAGVPFVVLLAAIMFLLSIVQIGPLPVLVICVGWLYWNGHTGWAIGLLVWSVLVDRLNSVLLPILVRRGVDLSLILVLVGVIGGLIAFGLIGIFIGPVVLAVSYKLLEAWISHEAEDTARLDDAPAMTTENVEANAFRAEEPTKSDS